MLLCSGGSTSWSSVNLQFSAQSLFLFPILVTLQLVTMQVFIVLLTASWPQAGVEKQPVLDVHCSQQVSVHPRQWWGTARGMGQPNRVTANFAIVKAWLLSKVKQNQVFQNGDNPPYTTRVILEGIIYLWTQSVTTGWLQARASLLCSSYKS